MNAQQFYINGQWVNPKGTDTLKVINPATENVIETIALGNAEDANLAIAAAKSAFSSFALTSRQERIELLESIIEHYKRRLDDVADIISQEMGAPITLAKRAHAPGGLGHFITALDVLRDYAFEETLGTTQVVKEPIGVCAMITPWNWPINQIGCKVAPALATGCSLVLKPSEVAPLNALLLTEILHEAGVPAGVFNLINGDGPTVGAIMSSHPDVDMVSFTGSTHAGIEVAKCSAPTVKRVTQELGGKSANIILEDADLKTVIPRDVQAVMMNSGQTCNAPTRMLVPRKLLGEVEKLAQQKANSILIGDPSRENTVLGPVVSEVQWYKVQKYIQQGLAEGASLIAGGVSRPDQFAKGYFVKPTVFSNVSGKMAIAQEEIFGPVLSIIPYDSLDEAIDIANDSPYGLSGYVSSSNTDLAKATALRLRTGMVHLNGAGVDVKAPFGGFKQSGNGREWGHHGFTEFLEIKAVMGFNG
ncbi:aldehyde dehydrogenase family protein [Aestuariicella hydrocarbonica]|uniref:Aldehyde dehydrogenase family protein n=1 Tax=Pseudomaricurvus hydrocarbonicus TaxID=1470433 RepID=A0A9E5MN44_9GAMM|nr:aldehyde dehydrogenase family protein [Aestuariicella hydrocarbonica]NHO67316.1 aldehyde dehydrogenase family protein [Aestuariicella hydrocarbonica]